MKKSFEDAVKDLDGELNKPIKDTKTIGNPTQDNGMPP
jgi:hypothetical protein